MDIFHSPGFIAKILTPSFPDLGCEEGDAGGPRGLFLHFSCHPPMMLGDSVSESVLAMRLEPLCPSASLWE